MRGKDQRAENGGVSTGSLARTARAQYHIRDSVPEAHPLTLKNNE
jgi:hypothetical protein